MKDIKIKDLITVGFALFAMFFGAGNLLFPPFLGLGSGPQWLLAFICYIIADAGLAIVVMIAVQVSGGKMENVVGRVGKVCATIIGISVALCIGPIIAIPRTGAVAFEMGAQPLGFNNKVIFCAIYFLVAFVLMLKGSKVVDIVGNFLTPFLLIGLIAMIIIGIVNPIGDISNVVQFDSVVKKGIGDGYQTLDALASLLFSILIINSANDKGYTDPKLKMKFVCGASIVAGIGLFIVYGGLAYLGATTSSLSEITFSEIGNSELVVFITKKLLGQPGVVILGIVVTLACMTTTIGLTASISNYFSSLSKGKIKYEVFVIIICLFSFGGACLGVGAIINIAAPILNLVYPAVLVLVILTFFKNQIKSDLIVQGATLFAFLTSLATEANAFLEEGSKIPYIMDLPLASLGLHWIIPAIVGGILGFILSMVIKPKQAVNNNISK